MNYRIINYLVIPQFYPLHHFTTSPRLVAVGRGGAVGADLGASALAVHRVAVAAGDLVSPGRLPKKKQISIHM